MDKPDPYGEWAIRGDEPDQNRISSPEEEAVRNAARKAWPHALIHARRELAGNGLGLDGTEVAAEVWERVVRSVSKALKRKGASPRVIRDLEAYLITGYRRRFNRVLKRERKWRRAIRYVPSTADLDRMANAQDAQWVVELERAITIMEIVAHMDEWTRKVWSARQYGYSWKEIAKYHGLSKQQAKMRFRYGLEKTRNLLIKHLRERQPGLPSR